MAERKKIYILSPAASGKTTFTQAYKTYRGYRIVDFDDELPAINPLTKIVLYLGRLWMPIRNLARLDPAWVRSHGEHYHENIFGFLRRTSEPIVVFGRKPPEDLSPYGDIAFGIVMISEADHERNARLRKSQMRNPIPFFHHWSTDFEKLREMRRKTEEYAARSGVPVFRSFETAIDTLSGLPQDDDGERFAEESEETSAA